MNNEKKNNELVRVILAFLGTMAGCIGVRAFNIYVLMSLPLGARIVSMIVVYWLIALIPIIIMLIDKDKLTDYGFKREKMGNQILAGLGVGIAMSVVLTLIPHLAGLGNYVDNGNRYLFLWQFIFEFVYCIISVAFTEEFVFRGLLYEKIRRIGNSEIAAVIGSSLLFGFFHILNGNLIQVGMTALIGLFFCLCRLKIKNCSTLSLIIAHGVYDALISVWIFVFAG